MAFFTTYRRQLTLAAGLLAAYPAAAQAPAWQSAGGAAFTTSPVAAAVDAVGNSYEVAFFSGTLAVGSTTLTSQGINDGYLAKYTPTGALAWVQQLGSAGNDMLQGVALDAAGNPYVTGYTEGTIALGNNLTVGTGSGRQVFVVRYSSQGTPVWAQHSTSNYAIGGGIALDASGNVYLAGIYSGPLVLGGSTLSATGSSPTFLARLSGSTGAVQSLTLACYFAPTGTSYSFQAPRLAVAATGAAYLVTTLNQATVFSPTVTLNTTGGSDVLVARYNAQGGFEWARQLGGAGSDLVSDATVDATGSVYVAGGFTGPATAGTVSLPGAGGLDGYLIKYSALGNQEWVQASGGSGTDTWRGVKLSTTGAPHVTGNFSATAQVAGTTLSSAGGTDVAVAAYSAQGVPLWAQQAGSPDTDYGMALGLVAGGGLYVRGVCRTPCAFGNFTLTAPTSSNASSFTAQLGPQLLAARVAAPLALEAYPNPATDWLTLPGLPAGSRAAVFDLLGRAVRAAAPVSAAGLPVRGLAPGLYVLRATDPQGQSYTGRFAVE